MTPRGLYGGYKRFGITCCPHLQGKCEDAGSKSLRKPTKLHGVITKNKIEENAPDGERRFKEYCRISYEQFVHLLTI
jgi:23S rRNA A1618 N6-methylase RlmF